MQTVLKSSGITEPYNVNKIFKVVQNACIGTDVDPYDVVNSLPNILNDGMSTADIQQAVTKLCADRISPDTPDYQHIAARLAMYGLRKRVYGQFDPPSLYNHTKRLVERGTYDPELLTKWTANDFDRIDRHIVHDRDMGISYAGVMQWIEKYLVKDRSTDTIFETPQFAYMLIAMCLHQDEKHDRIAHVLNYYDAISSGKLSLPTPILAGARTPTRQFSSCVKIESGDSLESINATAASVIGYISQRAGIGLNGGAIRAEGSKIRSGEVKHTGVIPFWKHFQTAVKSCSQGGVRGGAANLNYPMWHLEFEKLIVLKNNKGVEENRIRQLDYTVQINRLMLERLRDDDYITLFSPDIDGGQLYLDYFDNPERFKARYEELEKNPVVRKKRIKASDLFGQLGQERTGTGRIYVQFVDNVNAQGPYIEPIRMTNLCVEICLPTTPVGTPDAEIALCTLSAYNLGLIEGYDDFLKVARAAVRGLDNLLDYQDYPVEEALKAKLRRSLGMGVTNFAYFLAKNYVKYSDGSANKLVHRTFEMMQFANLVASMELAKERGASEWHYKTRWAQGQLPIDWYNKNVDKLVPNDLQCDWEWLRGQIKEHGLRNDTLSALMPCESSSQLTNSTNGIEPPRSLVSVKSSKDGVFNQVVPEIFMLGDEYETAWAMTKYGMKGYLSLVAIMQKFVDQGISANTYSDPSNTGGKISMETVLEDIAFCSHYGIKSLYYSVTRDGADGSEESKSDCDSCKV